MVYKTRGNPVINEYTVVTPRGETLRVTVKLNGETRVRTVSA